MGQQPSVPKPGTKFRVIGAGMSRTGTKTFNEALSILLDGPVHDSGVQSLGGPAREQKLWLEIMELAPRADRSLPDQKRLDYLLASVLDGYTSTMDCPACLLTPEILRVFPDAIVIVTTRDPKSWDRSNRYLRDLTDAWYLPFFLYWMPKINIYPTWRRLLRRMFVWRFGYEELKLESLVAHEDQVRSAVPPEKLFFYHVSDGWGPLCEILGVPVPDRPFPHNNKPDEAVKAFRSIITAGAMAWVGVLGAAGAAVWFASRKFM